jgi:hypothetical protein
MFGVTFEPEPCLMLQGGGEMEVAEVGETGGECGDKEDDDQRVGLAAIVAKQWCGKYAIASSEFTTDIVGSKSLNTTQLKASSGKPRCRKY